MMVWTGILEPVWLAKASRWTCPFWPITGCQSACTLLHPLLWQGGEGWLGQGEGAWDEDVQVYVLAPHSPLPALTIPPHRLTVQPANHRRDPRVLYPTHTSPATYTSPGATTGCRHPVYAAAPALYSPLPCSGPLPRVPGPSPRVAASHGTCRPPSTCCPPALTFHPPLHAAAIYVPPPPPPPPPLPPSSHRAPTPCPGQQSPLHVHPPCRRHPALAANGAGSDTS